MKRIIKKILQHFGVSVGRYPSPMMRGLRRILESNGITIVLDVGANSGFYARELRDLGYSNTIISFEPLLEPFHQLKAYAANSKWKHQVVNCALGELDGTSSIHVSLNSVSSSILEATSELVAMAPETKSYSKQEIVMHQLDSIIATYCDLGMDSIFLKIDAQGYEKKILAGATRSIPYIKAIQLEVSLIELYKGEWLLDELLLYMKQMGFSLYMVMPEFTDPFTGRQLQVDCVFIQEGL